MVTNESAKQGVHGGIAHSQHCWRASPMVLQRSHWSKITEKIPTYSSAFHSFLSWTWSSSLKDCLSSVISSLGRKSNSGFKASSQPCSYLLTCADYFWGVWCQSKNSWQPQNKIDLSAWITRCFELLPAVPLGPRNCDPLQRRNGVWSVSDSPSPKDNYDWNYSTR